MVEFDATISEQDLFKFNIKHNYTSFNGVVTVILAVVILVISIMSASTMEVPKLLMYLLIVLIFIVFPPMNLKLRAAQQFKGNGVFTKPLHYKLDENGVTVTSELQEEAAVLPWEYIYKVTTSNNYLYIYSSRVNAYILPKSQVIDKYPEIKIIFEKYVTDYKLGLKW